MNNETFIKIKFDLSEEKYYPLFSQLWFFIKEYIPVPENSFPHKQIKAIENEYGWLSEKNLSPATINLDNGQQLSFVYNSDKSILDQFIKLISSDKIEELYIISPFFDKQSQALKELEGKTKAKRVNVILQTDTVSLNYKTIPQSCKYNFYNYPGDDKYLHAKVYLAICKNHSHVLIGSSNCSSSGLGSIVNKSPNIEACIYSRIDDPVYFLSSLNLSGVISENNKLNAADLKRITFKEEPYNDKKSDINLLFLEYNRGNFIAYIENDKPAKTYTLVLKGKSVEDIVELRSGSVNKSIISFKGQSIQLLNYLTGYLLASDGRKSNNLLISYYQVLEENAPSPKAAQFYDIIDKINLENSDFPDLIAPFEKLIFYTPSKSSGFNFRKKNVGEAISEIETSTDEYITYDEFLNKTKDFNHKKSFYSISHNSGIVLLMEFLLSRIGIYKPDRKKFNKDNITVDLKLYDEEKNDEYLYERAEEYYSYAKKKHIKSIEQSEARYLKSKILHLGKRYIQYLDQIIKGISSENLLAPKYLDTIEIAKYFSISLLINYFAGKEYKIKNEVIEILELDGTEDKSHWNIVLNIIARVFSYQDTKFDHYCVLKKLRIENSIDNLTEDFIAALSLAAFNICFIWEYFKEDRWEDLEIIA